MSTADRSGVLVLDKPAGPTSHDLVARVRRALQLKRVGHAGTLDPFATGVLVACVGRATRLSRWFAGCDKTYTGVVRFGFATDSGDSSGRPRAEPVEVSLSPLALADAARKLTGLLQQVPPMHSAKKQGGRKLYELARRGEEVPRDPVAVRVERFRIGKLEGDRLEITVTCSAGTYLRVLAEELGQLVGCPAHLEALRRTGAGPFTLREALPVQAEWGSPTSEEAEAALIPLAGLRLPLPGVRLRDEEARRRLAQGRLLDAAEWSPEEEPPEPESAVAVRGSDGALVAVAIPDAEGRLRPETVLVDP